MGGRKDRNSRAVLERGENGLKTVDTSVINLVIILTEIGGKSYGCDVSNRRYNFVCLEPTEESEWLVESVFLSLLGRNRKFEKEYALGNKFPRSDSGQFLGLLSWTSKLTATQ